MCSTSSIKKNMMNSLSIMDPLGAIAANNSGGNNILKGLGGAHLAAKNMVNGEPATFETIGDPQNAFHQSTAQKAAAAYAAAAPQREADATLSAANNSLASLRQRRRAGSALATGGTSGGGMLSTVLAYGKTTLG